MAMQVVRGGFGHNPSGKLYSYYGRNLRVGQRVVVPVTHPISQKNYKTMFTVMQTNKADGQYGEQEATRLSDEGIGLKTIATKGNNVLDLPGGARFRLLQEKTGMSDMQAKSLWTLDSNIRYGEKHGENTANREAMRDRMLGLNPANDNTAAREQLLGGTG